MEQLASRLAVISPQPVGAGVMARIVTRPQFTGEFQEAALPPFGFHHRKVPEDSEEVEEAEEPAAKKATKDVNDTDPEVNVSNKHLLR